MKYNFKIDCLDTIKRIEELDSLLDNFCINEHKHSSFSDTEREVINGLEGIINKRYSVVNKLEYNLNEFFISKLNRFWKMTLTTDGEYNTYTEVYLLYPYRFISENDYLCCLRTKNIENNILFNAGVFDGGFELNMFFRKNLTIEMEEISKEEFIETCKENVDKVIEKRLQKVYNNG